jgi:putative sulfotransferase
MISNMLRRHPRLLSISEFFCFVSDGYRQSKAFSTTPLDGREFWQLLAAPPTWYNMLLRHGVGMDEFLYPHDKPGACFSPTPGIPAIMLVTLPHLTEDPDRLFHLLREDVESWPLATIAEHYRCLFDQLARRFDKPLWIERSGANVWCVPQYLKMFPEARFIHVVRDGRDAALSMGEHPYFRASMILMDIQRRLGADPLVSPIGDEADALPEDLRSFLPDRFDPKVIRAARVPLEKFGAMWTWMIRSGLEALAPLPADRLLTLRYEDFMTAPKESLDAIADFLGGEFVDPAWSSHCAEAVRAPRSRWRDLPQDVMGPLLQACRPGFEGLKAAGVAYSF